MGKLVFGLLFILSGLFAACDAQGNIDTVAAQSTISAMQTAGIPTPTVIPTPEGTPIGVFLDVDKLDCSRSQFIDQFNKPIYGIVYLRISARVLTKYPSITLVPFLESSKGDKITPDVAKMGKVISYPDGAMKLQVPISQETVNTRIVDGKPQEVRFLTTTGIQLMVKDAEGSRFCSVEFWDEAKASFIGRLDASIR